MYFAIQRTNNCNSIIIYVVILLPYKLRCEPHKKPNNEYKLPFI